MGTIVKLITQINMQYTHVITNMAELVLMIKTRLHTIRFLLIRKFFLKFNG